jgi:predicted DNA-binding transcriptional regulator AlpA
MQPMRSDLVATTTPPSFLRLNDLICLAGLTRSRVYRLMAANTAPAPYRLGARAVGLRDVDIAHLSARRPTACIGRRPM